MYPGRGPPSIGRRLPSHVFQKRSQQVLFTMSKRGGQLLNVALRDRVQTKSCPPPFYSGVRCGASAFFLRRPSGCPGYLRSPIDAAMVLLETRASPHDHYFFFSLAFSLPLSLHRPIETIGPRQAPGRAPSNEGEFPSSFSVINGFRFSGNFLVRSLTLSLHLLLQNDATPNVLPSEKPSDF